MYNKYYSLYSFVVTADCPHCFDIRRSQLDMRSFGWRAVLLLSRRVMLLGTPKLGRHHPPAATLVVLMIHTNGRPLVNDVVPGFAFSLRPRVDLRLRNESLLVHTRIKTVLNKFKRVTLSFLGSIRRAASLISILISGVTEKVSNHMYLLTLTQCIYFEKGF